MEHREEGGLACSLTIIKLNLASPNNLYTALIGGPHETFRLLSDQDGDSAKLLAHFVEGLAGFRELGPPKIKFNHIKIANQLMLAGLPLSEKLEEYVDYNLMKKKLFDATTANAIPFTIQCLENDFESDYTLSSNCYRVGYCNDNFC